MTKRTQISENYLKQNCSENEMAQISKQELNLKVKQLQKEEPKVQEDKNSLMYRFKQQLIAAWRPVPSYLSSIILFIILTTFFITLGVVMLNFTSSGYKFEAQYDNKCNSTTYQCQITFTVSEDVNPPIYLSYGLTNFNQNQRFFAISKSETQLQSGLQISHAAARQVCGSKTTNAQMGWLIAVDNTSLTATDVAFPCGQIAYSFFNDTFSMRQTISNRGIFINQTGIASPNDKQIYKNNNARIQGINLHNEHWLVWLRPAATNSFYKLWGTINQKLEKNKNYTIKASNNYKINFSEKWVKLAKANVFGENNIVLPIAYLVCGGMCVIILIGFFIGKIKQHFK